MINRFSLKEMEYDFHKYNKYFLYDLEREEGVDILTLKGKRASTVANLLKAFTHQPTPNLDEFIEILESK
jgi:hypothetical protein